MENKKSFRPVMKDAFRFRDFRNFDALEMKNLKALKYANYSRTL